MPLFTVTMNSNRSLDEKDRFSRAIHAQALLPDILRTIFSNASMHYNLATQC